LVCYENCITEDVLVIFRSHTIGTLYGNYRNKLKITVIPLNEK
jgi:hypothetical protein